jgi:hypothetical protein
MPVSTSSNTHYDQNIRSWNLIQRMHSGDQVSAELRQGAFESDLAYEARKDADWKPHTRDLISRLVGELFSRSGEVVRETEIDDQYLAAIGPEGESYVTQLINLTETLIAYDECWVVMDPAQGLMIAEPQHVPRWTSNAVVLRGTRTTGGSVFGDEQEEQAWTIYRDDSYEVYVQSDKEGVDEERVDGGAYEEGFAFDGPPARRITLPWKVPFGRSVARAHRSLFRIKSKMDSALTNSLGGLMQIATGGDAEMADAIKSALKSGAIAVPYDQEHGQHRSLNVGTEGLQHGSEALKRKRKELYSTAYQSLSQASGRMTASEVDARNRSGPAAAMSVLAETIQSAEESILPIAAKAEDSRREDPSPRVQWPTDFSNAFEGDEREISRDIFQGNLPVDSTTATDVVISRLNEAGFNPDRQRVEEAVSGAMDRAAQSPTSESFL